MNLPFTKKGILIFLLCCQISYGQLITSGGVSTPDLVQNTLVGFGIQILSVTVQDSTNAYGVFLSNGSNIGIEHGVVITTGVISGENGPVGPNNTPNAGIDNGTAGDVVIESLLPIGSQTFNATILEFTFIPLGDSVFLKYVFGSDEYPEYVGSSYGDAFGAFLTGPNPVGGDYVNQNFALIPNTLTPITINTINNTTFPGYYVDNLDGLTIEYDGFSKPFIARVAVIPDSTYTVRMVVAEAVDGIYDSGVFLEAFSFTSGTFIGMNDYNAPESFNIFPNPVNDFLQIQSKGNIPIESITIIDISGRVVLHENIPFTSTIVDISHLAPGIYTICSITNKENYVKKLIVQ